MSREAWALTKQNKNFNVLVFRRSLTLLILSLIVSCLITGFIFYTYIGEPEPDYYATNGATPPIKLTGLLAPNLSSTALLEPDPATDDRVKVIPQ